MDICLSSRTIFSYFSLKHSHLMRNEISALNYTGWYIPFNSIFSKVPTRISIPNTLHNNSFFPYLVHMILWSTSRTVNVLLNIFSHHVLVRDYRIIWFDTWFRFHSPSNISSKNSIVPNYHSLNISIIIKSIARYKNRSFSICLKFNSRFR